MTKDKLAKVISAALAERGVYATTNGDIDHIAARVWGALEASAVAGAFLGDPERFAELWDILRTGPMEPDPKPGVGPT